MLPEVLHEAAAVTAPPPVAAVALAPAPTDEPHAVPVVAAVTPAAEPVTAPAPAPAAIPAPSPAPRHEALAVITALSDDEKIALFS
jgi:hypothetical protein